MLESDNVHKLEKIYFKNFAIPVVNIHIRTPPPKYFSRYGPGLIIITTIATPQKNFA